MKRLDMGKAKEILRLRGKGFSFRDIALSVGCGKSAVGETIRRADAAGIKEADEYTEDELERILFPEDDAVVVGQDEPDMGYILVELSRKHVTRQLLWEEYKTSHPNGLMYSQFCERIRQARKANEIDYHKAHKAGEECEVDWAGTTIPYHDAITKAWKDVFLFVAVLPASGYPFAYAYPDQKMESWIDAHIKAFVFFGGTPRILVPDCTKTAVTTPDLFDPVLSKTYYEMAAHYGVTIVPARPRRPRDKAYAENTVLNVSRRIIAALRDEHFTSIAQVNKAVRKKLLMFIDRPFKKIEGCRRSTFEQTDRPALRQLPDLPYELAIFAEAKIGVNYHVEYDGFFYSVPYELRGKPCAIRATKDTIEVFIKGERVWAHVRNHNKSQRYTTLPEHLPEQHKAVSEWNDERFISWAEKFGPNTTAYIKALLASTEYSVQAYRASMGVFRQAESVAADVVEAASAIALEKGYFSSKYFGLAIKQAEKESEKPTSGVVVVHDNIRGRSAFEGGGYHD